VTERQLAAIARATPAEIIEIAPDRKRARSFNVQERLELVQGNWADRERERLVRTW
jgi:hypothetical protein